MLHFHKTDQRRLWSLSGRLQHKVWIIHGTEKGEVLGRGSAMMVRGIEEAGLWQKNTILALTPRIICIEVSCIEVAHLLSPYGSLVLASFICIFV